MTGKLLIPIDLAHESSWKKALPQGFALARATEADVTIMTVVPEIVSGLDWRYSIRGETGGSEDLNIEELLKDAQTRLAQIGTEQAPEGAAFDVIARYGTVYEEILNVAAELPATQIVMAAHRPSLADYLIGPNTARVVRHATCSVQVVRD
ncbi:MAG: universal stress protein [Pseudomonadota bacterium]